MPFAYSLVLFDKCRYIPQKPFANKKDLVLRVIDALVFIFIGPFYLGFWVIIDCFVNYPIMLFVYKLIYNDYEEVSKRKF